MLLLLDGLALLLVVEIRAEALRLESKIVVLLVAAKLVLALEPVVLEEEQMAGAVVTVVVVVVKVEPWTLGWKGRRRKGGGGGAEVDPKAAAERKTLRRDLAKGDEDVAVGAISNGGDGMPVNCCTMARKLEVSVFSTVVCARREALDRFFELRGAAADWSGGCTGVG